MTTQTRYSFLFLCLVAFPLKTALAPISYYYSFPGLDKLIERADTIALIKVRMPPRPLIFIDERPKTVAKVLKVLITVPDYENYEVSVLKALKGNIPKGNLTVSLKNLPLELTLPRTDTGASIRQSFDPGTTHIVFLEELIFPEGPIFYRNLNIACSHFLVSAVIYLRGHYSLEHLKTNSTKEGILILLKDFIANHRADQYAAVRKVYKSLIDIN